MKIIISEKQLEKILDDSEIISEQVDVTNDQRTLIVLQNKVNDLVDKKEKEILDQTSVKISLDGGNVLLELGEKKYPMKPMVKGVYALIIPPKNTLSFGSAPMSGLMEDIEKIPEYKTLVEKYPEIKEQISKTHIRGMIFTDEQNQGTFKFMVTRQIDPKDMKSAVSFGTEYPLGEFMGRNKLIYKFKNETYGTLESGMISMNLQPTKLMINPVKNQEPVINIAGTKIRTLDLQDIFEFDGVEFKSEGALQQLGSYVQEIKGYIQKYGQAFIDGYKSQNPTVLGYASVDGDPNQQITGGYNACSGNRTRRDYDFCLSQERARKIAEELNKAIPELDGAIKYKGMGQTIKWGPGWKKESPTIPEQTSPNRRYILPSIQIGKTT